MKAIRLSLTRSRQIGVACWALILLASVCAYQFPVRGLPLPARAAVAVLLAAAAVAVIITSLGLFTEKGDERAQENERRANSTLFTLFFLCMGACIFLTKDGRQFTMGRPEVLAVFAAVCLARDILFLGYERFAH